MKNIIIAEICKNLKWYERIIVKILKHIFIKVYHKIRIDIINSFLET